jgi:hypothetical protein
MDRSLHPDPLMGEATTPELPRHDGAIPFRIRIGVTGHVDLEPSPALDAVLREQVRAIQDELLFATEKERYAEEDPLVRLAVVSQLAKGGDRLVVDAVFAEARERRQEARLEVILPMSRWDYFGAQGFSDEDAREFDRLWKLASWRYPLTPTEQEIGGEGPFRNAGRQLVSRCDILIALWDGEPSGGPGGTADTLLEAARVGRPCIWIKTPDGEEVRDNFRPGSSALDFYDAVQTAAAVPRTILELPDVVETDERMTLRRLRGDPCKPLRDSFRQLRRFNRADVGEDGLEARAVAELGGEASHERWVARPFARASVVADRRHVQFELGAGAVLALGAAAAVFLGMNVTETGLHGELASALEFASLAAAPVLFLLVRQAKLHGRWLSARVLAERLRSAFSVAPTYCDFRRVVVLDKLYIERSSSDWVGRALEEVWDRRPQAGALEGSVPEQPEQVRSQVARWIAGQIRYHGRAARRHRRWDGILTWAVWVLVVATVAAAFAHLLDEDSHRAVLLTITLPAIAAAIGAWLTITQHRALHTRFVRMESDLALVLDRLLESDSDLKVASRDAARIISREGEDWLGTMWFLDVEHP